MTTTRVHRSALSLILTKLRLGRNIDVARSDIERQLGYPLIEADMVELRGALAALNAVYDATEESR